MNYTVTKADLQRIERKLDLLLKKQPRKFWVKVNIVTDVTGWDSSKMQDARQNGYIEYKTIAKEGKREFWYNINSLNPLFYSKKQNIIE
ncbi:MAG TPA: hypothetical protein VD794_08615 [Flavisolibacter sp.]|nr:hypothetical protein [Flavisolibacter sp.]